MVRKLLTTISLLGLLLSVGLWGVSFVGVSVSRTALPWQSGAMVIKGNLGIVKMQLSQNAISTRGISNGIDWDYGASLRVMLPFKWKWTPTYWSPRKTISVVSIPLYLPTLLFGVWPVWLLLPFDRRRKRKKLGLCLKCGYDLRASKDICPECGEEFETTLC